MTHAALAGGGNNERRLGAILPIRNLGREQSNRAVFMQNRRMPRLTRRTAMMMPTTVIVFMKRNSRGSLKAYKAGQKKHDEKTQVEYSGFRGRQFADTWPTFTIMADVTVLGPRTASLRSVAERQYRDLHA